VEQQLQTFTLPWHPSCAATTQHFPWLSRLHAQARYGVEQVVGRHGQC
jgi:hypothetical protein